MARRTDDITDTLVHRNSCTILNYPNANNHCKGENLFYHCYYVREVSLFQLSWLRGLYIERHVRQAYSFHSFSVAVAIRNIATMYALLSLLVTVALVSGREAEKLAPRYLDEFSVDMMKAGLRIRILKFL